MSWSPSARLLALHEEHSRLDASVRDLTRRHERDLADGHTAEARALTCRLHELRSRRWLAREDLVTAFVLEAMGAERAW